MMSTSPLPGAPLIRGSLDPVARPDGDHLSFAKDLARTDSNLPWSRSMDFPYIELAHEVDGSWVMELPRHHEREARREGYGDTKTGGDEVGAASGEGRSRDRQPFLFL